MSDGPLLGIALWTARRNGRALARSVGKQYEKQQRKSPQTPSIQRWQSVLEHRRGWKKVRSFVYMFHEGERLELKPTADSLDHLDWLATIELKNLSRGMPPATQTRLLKESVLAARSWWSLHQVKP